MRAQKTALRSTLRFSGLVTGAATALIGFGGTAHADPVLSPDVAAAAGAIIDSLATGSAGSSGSSDAPAADALPAAVAPPVTETVAPPVTTVTAAAPPETAPPETAPPAITPVPPAAPTFALPGNGILTSTFGDGRNHQGIDLAGPIGDPIFAASAGKVIDAGPAQGFGLWVRIKHADGTITTYGHNNENLVKVGDVVTTGQQIATVGNRGDSTGPHLHFEVKLPDGNNTDPLAWLTERGIEVRRNNPTPAPAAPTDTAPTAPVTPDPATPDPVTPDPVTPDTLA